MLMSFCQTVANAFDGSREDGDACGVAGFPLLLPLFLPGIIGCLLVKQLRSDVNIPTKRLPLTFENSQSYWS